MIVKLGCFLHGRCHRKAAFYKLMKLGFQETLTKQPNTDCFDSPSGTVIIVAQRLTEKIKTLCTILLEF